MYTKVSYDNEINHRVDYLELLGEAEGNMYKTLLLIKLLRLVV